ncbi:CHAT domain-containing protein [Hyalangium sp.]|uniref:CHAT domain-containing protein n=1 Tax=Hyalangium sp. TaxID=2028555 RepID=UPI002D6506CC|nr:CHAT domain-containing protein [Hyalangium sp.]HYI00649.1 CHAT domain-containing protein [Hyalangium sp.]
MRLLAVGLPVAGLAVVVAILGLLSVRASSSEEEASWLSSGQARSIEARLSHPAADRHRPYHATVRGSGGGASGAPLEVLARLEAKGDLRGLAAAYLTQGAPELAASYLERAVDSPEVLNDRAVIALSEGDAADAIALLEKVLLQQPRSAQALWNRGLALRDLELWSLSAEAFDAVAVLGEPGWADEARTRAGGMRERVRAEQQGWEEANRAGAALVLKRGTVSAEELRAKPDLYRLYLYDAIRAAPDRQRLQELWPVAETLDAHFGGSVLRDAIRWAEARDFQRRAPLAALYASVFQDQSVPGGMPAYLEKVRASGELDILLGTLVFAQEVSKDVEGYARLAQQSRDPWFMLLAEHERAKVALANGELLQAEQILLAATRQCRGGTLAYRCGTLLVRLHEVYRQLWLLPEAMRSVREALPLMRRAGFWWTDIDRLMLMGQIARLQGQGGLARALLDESLARLPGNCEVRHTVRANDALALLEEMRVAEARAAMREALECGGVQLLSGAMTLAELSRLSPEPEQDQRLVEGLETLRREGRLSPGRLAVASHIEGRFLIEQDRARGEALLRRSIQEANPLPPTNAEAREARALSYASLMLAAGKAGEWSRVLALFSEEAGDTLPKQCLLAVTVDRERTLVVALGPDGQLQGHYDESRRQPLGEDARGVVPEALTAPLRACTQVRVLARPPLHGRSGLLPDDIAWSYLVLPVSRSLPPATPAQRLIVKDVEPPPALELPRLGAWEPVGAGIHVLAGADATPARVLEAMTRATEIEIHAHGLVNPTVSDASLIVLSPESGGRYALTAAEVRAHRLEGYPLVTLAACRAAYTGLQVHEPFSLPAAFIEAGARTVLAATVDIPDAEAGPFFLAVHERIRAGQAAAPALRDVRQEWLRSAPESWVRSVLVFQ